MKSEYISAAAAIVAVFVEKGYFDEPQLWDLGLVDVPDDVSAASVQLVKENAICASIKRIAANLAAQLEEA